MRVSAFLVLMMFLGFGGWLVFSPIRGPPSIIRQREPPSIKCRADETRVWARRETLSSLDYFNPKPLKGYCEPNSYGHRCPAGQKVFVFEYEGPATRAVFLRGLDYVCVPGG